MKKTMQAVAYLEPGRIEIKDMPVPHPARGELLVRVRAATTCGTDVKTYLRGHPKFPPPFIFGHEFGGDIIELGEGVNNFQIGDRVTANVNAECGQCFYCQKGQGNICENLEYNFGSFAEYHIIPQSIVRLNTFKIPEEISYPEAAVVEPLVCVVHGFRKLQVTKGDRVVILGAGGAIGLLFQQLAQLSGAEKVIAIGHSDFRLDLARELGAGVVHNSSKGDPYELVMEHTSGYGADKVIECAGRVETWETGVQVARRGGQVLWFGGLPKDSHVHMDPTRIHYGEIDLLNTHGGSARDAREAFELICSKKINTRILLTAELPLKETETALQRMIDGQAVKMVIKP